MRKFCRIKRHTLNVIAANGYNTRQAQIFSCIGRDESCLGQEIGVKHIKRLTFVFFHNEFKPIEERVINAFMRAEAYDADVTVVGGARFSVKRLA